MKKIRNVLSNRAVCCSTAFLANAFIINAMCIAGGGAAFAVVSGDLADIGNELDSQGQNLSNGISTLLYLAGFTGAGVGVYKIGQSKKQQGQGMGEGVTWGIVGSVLMSLPSLMSFLSASTFGGDATVDALGRLDVE